jgi:multimeric flavodoxin WrbA
MKILIITCSPNTDGLTAVCGEVAALGIQDGKGEAVVVRLNDMQISKCAACNNGWGTCREKGICQVVDDFQLLHRQIGEADGIIVVTPVYWWDMSESAKVLFDRLRRCEAMKDTNKIKGKPFICIAAAGGTGVGTITCLSSLERVFLHMNNLQYFDLSSAMCDFIGVTQKNRKYMLETIRAAAKQMIVTGLKLVS